MSGLFALRAPCPLFAPVCDTGDWQTLSFQRATKDQNSAGELLLSFAAIGTFLGELQPFGGGYVRALHGTVVQIDALFIVTGNPAVQEGDRCTVSQAQMEIASTQQYGQEHCEISLRHVGR